MRAAETASQLLNIAQVLVQQRGFNAFSYKDLAETVGIKTASVHYHFPAKTDLGVALMKRYTEELDQVLAKIDRTGRTNRAKLKSFIKLYSDTEASGSICLCGSLAADQETLAPPLQRAVADYLDRSEQWVAKVIGEGIRNQEFGYSGKASDLVAALISSLQGGLILSRARNGRTPVLTSLQRVFFKALGTA
jgi:TetR/AcrR family transcriptional repressor of nem operon